MKLLNYTTLYFSIILIIIIPIWAGLFYFAMLDEIYDSMDDGLDNQRQLIITKAAQDTSVLNKNSFDEGNYSIGSISKQHAKGHKDIFMDTLMYMQNEKEYEPVRLLKTVFISRDKYYSMHIITSMVEEDDLISQLTRSLLWLYLGLIGIIILLNNSLLKNIWKPFYSLMNQLRDFDINQDRNLELTKTPINEFTVLQLTIQRFLKNNIETYNKQKQFIENASHELQTPVAIVINKLELLAESSQLQENEAELLASALNNLERLKRLNKSLLLLSKIENNQLVDNQEVNVVDLCKRVIENLNDQIFFYNLELILENKGYCTWIMNADLADVLVTNLIKNAIKHSKSGERIRILITNQSLTIENEGNAALDEQIIFQRFQKDSKSADSTGLGLAIVKAIAFVSNLKINYQYKGKHIFSVEKKL